MVCWGGLGGVKSRFDLRRGFFAPNQKIQKIKYVFIGPINTTAPLASRDFEVDTLSPPSTLGVMNIQSLLYDTGLVEKHNVHGPPYGPVSSTVLMEGWKNRTER